MDLRVTSAFITPCEVSNALFKVIGNLDALALGDLELMSDCLLVHLPVRLVPTQQDADVNSDGQEDEHQDANDDEDVDWHACLLDLVQETFFLLR